jgi:hypothetical protein
MSTPKTTTTKTTLVPRPSATAFVRLPTMETLEQDPTQVKANFPWFREENLAQAQQHLSGLAVARDRAFTRQIKLYEQELVKIVTADIKDRVVAFTQEKLGFPGFAYYHADGYLSASSFKGERLEIEGASYQWEYYPLESFPQLIPPHALQALQCLEHTTGIRPQAYWVADLQPVRHLAASKDPVLCAQLHRWFVGLAAWL